jgi:hypothetical protein
MAKEVKVFNGTVTATTTLYTVPAGRVSKVTIGTLTLTAFTNISGTSNIQLVIGGQTIASLAASVSTSVNATTTNFLGPGTTNVIPSPGAGQKLFRSNVTPSILDSEIYLAAGGTVSITGTLGGAGSAISALYSFSAVEEF